MNTAQVIPFRFEAREVRTLLIDDQPWFVATDVAAALCYRDAFNMCRNLDDDEKGTQIVSTPKQDEKGTQIVRTPGGDQEMLVINESGLYSAILRSRKAEAKRFKKWVTAEVLPAIRKHGRYEDAAGAMGTLIGETIGTNGFNMLRALIKGKVASLPAPMQRSATAKIWSQTHAAFGVRSAADIPASQLDAARNFIAAYALEGEWLGKEKESSFSDGDWLNLNALIVHMLQISKYYREFDLFNHFYKVGSPVGGKLHDHMRDGEVVAKYLQKNHGERMAEEVRKTQEFYERALAEREVGRAVA